MTGRSSATDSRAMPWMAVDGALHQRMRHGGGAVEPVLGEGGLQDRLRPTGGSARRARARRSPRRRRRSAGRGRRACGRTARRRAGRRRASQLACLPSTWAASDGVKPETCTSPRDTSRFSVAFCAVEDEQPVERQRHGADRRVELRLRRRSGRRRAAPARRCATRSGRPCGRDWARAAGVPARR